MAATQVSIILPTYNESQNIVGMLRSIGEIMPKSQTIVVDDNSPDGTGHVVEEYLRNTKRHVVEIIHRKTKTSLSAAIMHGIQHARGETIVVMDSDMSHPPQLIPKLVEALRHHCDIAVASRYMRGGDIVGWPVRRRLLSHIGTKVARWCLGIKESDPMSGFFAFRRSMTEGISFDGLGFKMLMEMLVKAKGARIIEIPYTFRDRTRGRSKLGWDTIFDYARSVWRLYIHSRYREERRSVRFLYKAGRFFTVGALGFLVNYLVSYASGTSAEVWYIHANMLGIVSSMSTNFVLNKVWTFQDHDFGVKRVLSQYGKFVGLSSAGAAIQLGIVYSLVEDGWSYPLSLAIGVLTAALGNFLLNKKITFGEKLWS